METKRRAVLWFIIIRLIVITSLVLSSVIILQFSTAVFLPLTSFYLLVLIFYGVSICYFLFFFLSRRYELLAYIQIIIDLFLITALVYISGGVRGSFYILYIFGIIAASVVLSERAAYLVASFSAVFFSLLVDGLYFGVIPYLDPEMSGSISLGVVINNIIVAWAVFFLVAFLVNFLTGSLKRTRAELARMSKELEVKRNLAVAGEVSAQLAHEIRNPLAAISGSVQVLRNELNPEGEQRKLMDIVVNESSRISRSIEQFLSLASTGDQTLTSIEITPILEETIILLKRSGELDEAYRLEGNYRNSRLKCFGNRDQFKQIYWNLLKNAIKAMPEGGVLTIDFVQKGQKVIEMRFKDTGFGMNGEELENIFKPFYSGFEGGKGIGMSVVHRIVGDYGGSIRVDSLPDRGTEVVIILPCRLM